MLTIRLQRVGKKNQPVFRIVLAEKHRAASKKAVEILGHYNPRSKEFGIKSEERLKYWIAEHVQISPTVHNLFVDKKILTGVKVKAWNPKRKPAEEAGKKETAPAVAETAAPTEETKIEEPKAESPAQA